MIHRRSTSRDIADRWQRKRRTRRSTPTIAVNLAPLMDIMFNLLVFFLVATSFELPEGLLAARLPRTTGLAARASIPLVPIRVYLEPSATGTEPIIRVSSSLQADAASLTMATGFDELYGVLNDLRQRAEVTGETPVIIAARDATAWDQVVDAYNAAARAQFSRIVFANWK